MELLIILPMTLAIFGLLLPRLMNKTIWTGPVVSAITHSHSYQFILVQPFGHLLRKSQHAGLSLAFEVAVAKIRHLLALSYVPVILCNIMLNYIFRLTDTIFSNFCKH